jgi:hypothetical protein
MHADDTQTLRAGEGGPYAELSRRPNPDGLALLFIPSLAAVLARAEQLKGGELTRDEVDRIRDVCNVVATPEEMVAPVEERRTYEDLDPAEAYEGWQRLNGRG